MPTKQKNETKNKIREDKRAAALRDNLKKRKVLKAEQKAGQKESKDKI